VKYEAKTRPTTQSVAAYLDAIDDEARRRDCKTLAALMKRVIGCAPTMRGASMVGFSARKGPISVYMAAGCDVEHALPARLGKHKVGKACLYINRLADVDLAVLEQLLARSAVETKKRYPTTTKKG
jgi:hypothetical protein